MSGERRCVCGHTHRQHEVRSGGLFGCFIHGCTCVDMIDEEQVRAEERAMFGAERRMR